MSSVTSIKYYDEDNVEQIWDATNYELVNENQRVPAQIHPATNVTLVASPKTAKTLFPFVKGVEKKMRRAFPGTLREGCDPRSAHIAVLEV